MGQGDIEGTYGIGGHRGDLWDEGTPRGPMGQGDIEGTYGMRGH